MEVLVERTVDDKTAFGQHTWVGVFGDPITSGAAARRWLSSDERVFGISLVENERPANLVILAPDCVQPMVHRIEPSASRTLLTVGPPCGRDLVGEVRVAGGGVVAGAEMTIAAVEGWASELPERVRPRWRSSAEGGVVIPGVVAGRYEVSATAEGYVPLAVPIVVSGDAARRFDLEMLPVAKAVAGRVVGPTGLGIEGAAVVAAAGPLMIDGTSGKGGRFALGPFEVEQAVSVTASRDQYTSPAERVRAGVGDLEIVLGSAVGISGTVFDQSTGAPIDSFEITIHVEGESAQRKEGFRNGRFAMELPRPATTIEVRASGYAPWKKGPRSLRLGEGAFLEVALERGRVLTGRVVAAAGGLPIAGATVKAPGYVGSDKFVVGISAASTDSEGRFELHVPGGERPLRVSAAGYAPKTVRVHARAGEPLKSAWSTAGLWPAVSFCRTVRRRRGG